MLHTLDNNCTVQCLLLFMINFTAIKFAFSFLLSVLLTRLIITGRLISEKLNNCFVAKHCFSNHKTVNLVNVCQIVFVRKKNIPWFKCFLSFSFESSVYKSACVEDRKSELIFLYFMRVCKHMVCTSHECHSQTGYSEAGVDALNLFSSACYILYK